MKNTLYAIVAACVATLATSGIVALATAAPSQQVVEMDDAEFDAWISEQIDAQYRQILERK